jgi:hypothetical protein
MGTNPRGGDAVEVTFVAGSLRLGGEVVDDFSGGPIADATISLMNTEGEGLLPEALGVVTDTNGRFQLTGLSPGRCSAVIRAPGHAQVSVDVVLAEGAACSDLNVHLAAEGALKGRITAEGTGVSIAGAAVLLAKDEPAGQSSVTMSDQSGAYSVRGLPAGAYRLVVFANGRQSVQTHVQIDASRDTVLDLSMAVAATAVSGCVRDDRGQPLPGADVVALGNDGQIGAATTTGEDGAFLIAGLAEGTYVLRASAMGHVAAAGEPISLVSGANLVLAAAAADMTPAIPLARAAVLASAAPGGAHLAAGLSAPQWWDDFWDQFWGESAPACEKCIGPWDNMISAQRKWLETGQEFDRVADQFNSKALAVGAKLGVGLGLIALVGLAADAAAGAAAAAGVTIEGIFAIESLVNIVGGALGDAAKQLAFGKPSEAVGEGAKSAYESLAKETAKLEGLELVGKDLTKVLRLKDLLGKVMGAVDNLVEIATTAIENWGELCRLWDAKEEAWKKLGDAKRDYDNATRAYYACKRTCKDQPPKNPPGGPGNGGTTTPGGTHDPNDKLGPAGYDELRYLSETAVLPYTVRFENDPTATASCQLITIADQMDADLD